MVDINTTIITLTQPLASGIQTLSYTLQLLVGGVFGIYVIIAVLNFYSNRKQRKEMKEFKQQVAAIHKTLEDIKQELIKKSK